MAENVKEMCVTGGTGFIAAYLIRALLNKGYIVRTTVRNPDNVEKIGYLWDLPGAKQRLKIMKADLLEEGSFDEVVNGVDGVFHTACPVPNAHSTMEAFVDPSVNGALNVLKSCSRSPSVKRVVLTSSCSSIRYDYNTQELSPLDESIWSNPEYCKQYKLWYAYAKTLAEKEAWKYAEEQGLDLVTVNPSFVVGPLLAAEPTSSLALVLNIMKEGNNKTYPNMRLGFVHIDDVIAAHIMAMEAPSASGRIICTGVIAHFKEIVKMLKEKYPMYPIADQCGTEQGNATPHTMNTGKIRSLGFGDFKSVDQMFEDCLEASKRKDCCRICPECE